ncbi:type II secretion system F family protein [Vibrio sp. TRT 21S02]|uniref:type II secretion system F family protein n=1 Tax=Vibrio sp. TRT 21S02 TaxID=3418507 RepID=UPI003CF708D2
MNVLLLVGLVAVLLLLFAEQQWAARRFQTRKQLVLSTSTPRRIGSVKLQQAAKRVGHWLEQYLVSEKDRAQLKLLLLRAGYFKPEALPLFLVAKFGAVVVGLAVSAMVFAVKPELMGGKNTLIAVMIVFGLGVLVEKAIAVRGEARQSRLSQYCPDMMDMLVICAESGAGLDDALDKVSKKMRTICPELSDEVALVVDELKLLPDRSMALNNLANRTQVEELKILATTLHQALNYGSSIAKTLRVVASDTRQTRLLSMEEQAAKVPAKMGLPLILLVLFPTLFLIAAPAMIGLMEALS